MVLLLFNCIGLYTWQFLGEFQLQPIEYLLGSTAKLGEIIALGMLTQMKEVSVFRTEGDFLRHSDHLRSAF